MFKMFELVRGGSDGGNVDLAIRRDCGQGRVKRGERDEVAWETVTRWGLDGVRGLG